MKLAMTAFGGCNVELDSVATGVPWYAWNVRWGIVAMAVGTVIACGEADGSGDDDAGGDAPAEGGAGGTPMFGGGGANVGGGGGTGGTAASGGIGGSPGGAGGSAGDASADALPGDDGADGNDAGEMCLKACEMFVALNCQGGPNTMSECSAACATFKQKGAACEGHIDKMYGCFVAAGSQSIACGTYGAQPRCGYCDALVADLSKYCGFSTPCVP